MDNNDKKPGQSQQGDKANTDRNAQQDQRDSGSKQPGGGKSEDKSRQNR